jgi:hypothetical protein
MVANEDLELRALREFEEEMRMYRLLAVEDAGKGSGSGIGIGGDNGAGAGQLLL